MNTTTQNVLKLLHDEQLIDLREVDGSRDFEMFCEELDKIISAAVAAEREACAKVADNRIKTIKSDNMYPAYGLDAMQYEAERISAAIRARGKVTK